MKYTARMKKFPSIILKERKSNQSEILIKKRHDPLPNNPIANTVVGLNVSPSFPEMIFPAAYVPMKTVSIAERIKAEKPASFWSCCLTVE